MGEGARFRCRSWGQTHGFTETRRGGFGAFRGGGVTGEGNSRWGIEGIDRFDRGRGEFTKSHDPHNPKLLYIPYRTL